MTIKEFLDWLGEQHAEGLNAYGRIAGFLERDDVTIPEDILQRITSAHKILTDSLFEQLMLPGGVVELEELSYKLYRLMREAEKLRLKHWENDDLQKVQVAQALAESLSDVHEFLEEEISIR